MLLPSIYLFYRLHIRSFVLFRILIPNCYCFFHPFIQVLVNIIIYICATTVRRIIRFAYLGKINLIGICRCFVFCNIVTVWKTVRPFLRQQIIVFNTRRDGWSRPLPLGAPRPMRYFKQKKVMHQLYEKMML